MSNSLRNTLLEEANDLGLEFPSNIPTKKLGRMIAEFKGEPVPVEEEPPPSPAAIPDEPQEESGSIKAKEKESAVQRKFRERREAVIAAKKRAMKTRIVTLTNKDSRENEVMTTAYLSAQNQHFGIARIVPLDIPVELEECLIHVAETAVMTLHKDEIVNGKRTGNKVPVRTLKYAISYGRTTE